MTTAIGIGTSQALSAQDAGRAAAEQALTPLGGAADLFIVFSAAGYDHRELLDAIGAQSPGAQVVGCSGEGIIARDMCNEGPHVVGVMAMRSDAIRAETCLVPGYADGSAEAGRELVRWAETAGRGEGRLLIVLADGLSGNCTEMLEVLDQGLPGVPVVGGTAADGMVLEQTFQFHGTDVVTGHVAAVLLCGDVEPVVAVSHGCSPLGLPRTITRAEGAWVHEIDGRTAWDVFKEYLDGEPEDLNADGVVHLCIGEPLSAELADGYDPYVVNTPLALDASTGALLFPGGRLHQGQRVQLMRRDPDKIERSARACADRIGAARPGADPCMMFQFDCAGRGQVMFGSMATRRTVKPVQAGFADTVPWLGFHTFGEIAPIGGQTYFHTYTVALCALYEGRT